METIIFDKTTKIFFLLAIFSLLAVPCFQVAAYGDGHSGMAMPAGGAGRNMMPCCEGDPAHLETYNIPSERNFIALLFLAIAFAAAIFSSRTSYNFPIFSYALLAPPGPDILSTVVKRE